MTTPGAPFRTSLLLALTFAVPLLGAGAVHAGQAGVPGPAVEVGASLAVATSDWLTDVPRVSLAPRLTVNLTERTAVAVWGDVFSPKQYFDAYWQDEYRGGIEARRLLYGDGALRVSGLAGAYVQRHRIYNPPFTFPGQDPRFNIPESLGVWWRPAFSLGLGLNQRLSPQLDLHEDVRVVLSDEAAEFHAQVGVSMPFRRYPSEPVTRTTAYGPTTLRTGQHVWVTDTQGRETEGALAIVDGDRLEVVTGTGRITFTRPDISRLAIADSLVNGTSIGAIVGGAGMAGLLSFIAAVLCEEDCTGMVPAFLIGGATGVGVGAVSGALLDSLRDRPRVVYGSPAPSARAVTVAPYLTRDARGARLRITW